MQKHALVSLSSNGSNRATLKLQSTGKNRFRGFFSNAVERIFEGRAYLASLLYNHASLFANGRQAQLDKKYRRNLFRASLGRNLEQLERREVFDAFGVGNLAVFRVGNGAGTLANTGNAVFIDEYTSSGAFVQSIALPTTSSGTNRPLVASGTATSEGMLTRSTDGSYLVLAGYGATIPNAGTLTSTVSTAVNRVIGRIDSSGNVDTSTALTDASSGNNPRSVASVDGTSFWIAGGSGGVRYAAFGSTTSTQVNTGLNPLTNVRTLSIFDNQLYLSTGSGSAVRIGAVGTGTPEDLGADTANLPGLPTAGSPYQFFMADLSSTVPGVDTLYVADDGGTGGGLLKYSLVSGNWVSNGSIPSSNSVVGTARGLTGTVSGSSVTLFGTNGSGIFSVIDTAGYNAAIVGTPTQLATATANTAFRGIAFTPFPSVDSTPPQVSSIDDGDADNNVPVNSTMTYTVTFNEDIDGTTVNVADFDNEEGTATIIVNSVTQVSPRVFTVSVTPTSEGDLQLRVNDSNVIRDLAGNVLVTPFLSADVVAVTAADTTAPTVLSIASSDADNLVPAGTALLYTIVFSEDVDSSTITSTDFDNEGTASITIGTITETIPGTVTVEVTPTSAGTLKLRIPTGSVIADVAGNSLVVPVSDNDTITVDATAPTITSFTNSSTGGSIPIFQPVTYTINFSEDISSSSITLADFASVGTATVSISNLFRVSTTQYTVRLTPTSTGTLQLEIPTGAIVSDVAGNNLSVPFTDSVSLNVVATTELTAGDIAFTGIRSDDTDSFSFVLLKDVVAGTSLTFNDNAWTNATSAFATNENVMTIFFAADTPAGSHIKYTAPVTGTTPVPSSLVLVGSSTSVGSTVGDINGLSTSGDSILAYQGLAPVSGGATNWIAAISTRSFTANPSGTNQTELPTALTLGSTALQLSATATDVDNGVYSLPSLVGTPAQIRASINSIANWTINDDPALVPEVTTAFTVGADTTPPTIVSIDDGDTDNSVLVNTTLVYTVTFSEDIDAATVTAADFENAGTASITIGSISETSPGVFSVSVTPTTDGTLILRIPAGAVISDLSGNNLTVPVQHSDVIDVLLADTVPPAVLSITSSAPSNAAVTNEPIIYTIVFSEPIDLATVGVSDFDNAGSATVTIGTIAQAVPGTLTVTVTPTTSGTVILRVPTGATIADASGNNLVVPVQDNDTVNVADLQPIYINELMFNPPDTDAPNEYIELRGTPNATIPAGTYFVGIEGDAASLGDVQNVFNLSGFRFGTNGILVLLQKGSTYTPAAGSAVYINTGSGAGWGSGASSSVGHSGDNGGTDIENASATYMIIRAAVAPSLSDDIDTIGGTQGDGTPDGPVFASWTIMDSVGVLDNSAAGDFSYAALTFANSAGGGTAVSGTVVPVAFTAGYLARIGTSTGSAASDWLAADISTGTAPNYSIPSASVSQTLYAGSPLSHIGASNNFSLAPTDITLSSTVVTEGLPVNTVVGTFTTTDPDTGDTVFVYSLVAGNGSTDNASFAISGSTLVTNAVFDFETKSSYSIRVRTTDPAGGAFEKELTIGISDAADAPSVSPQTFLINNKSLNGALVGNVVATGLAGETLTYAITSGNASGAFSIDAATGAIRIANAKVLPVIAKGQTTINAVLTVSVSNTDVDPLSSTAQMTVTLSSAGIRMAPTVNAVTFTLAENNKKTDGTTKVGAIKPLASYSGQKFAFQALSGADAASFNIDEKGGILLASGVSLDFETKATYTFNVNVADSVDPTKVTTQTVTLNVANINEAPVYTLVNGSNTPVAITKGAATITLDENIPGNATKNGLVIGTLTVADQDQAASTLTYQTSKGLPIVLDKTGAFGYNHVTGEITIVDETKVDFEKSKAIKLSFIVTDDPIAGDAKSKAISTKLSVTVALNDLNEAPVISGSTTFNIAENNKAGAKVGSVKAVDADKTKQTLTYTIQSQLDAEGEPVAVFAIDSKGGINIPTAGSLNFEQSGFYTLVVRVTDSGTPTLFTEETITVNVLDVNEAATFALTDALDEPAIALTLSKAVIANDDVVGNLQITDVDAGLAGTYATGSITAAVLAASNGGLTYDETTGDLIVADVTKLIKTFDLKLSLKDTAAKPVTSKLTVKINITA